MDATYQIHAELLHSEHQKLAQVVDTFRKWWKSQRQADKCNVGELSRRVMDLHDQVMSHTLFEEDQGYFELASQLHPEQASQAAQLMEEHRQLRQSFQTLATRLASGHALYSSLEEFDSELEDLLYRLSEHERVEDDFFKMAFEES